MAFVGVTALIGVLTALLTAFYTFRMVYLVFAGDYRGTGHPHEIPLLMRWPLWPLANLQFSPVPTRL